MATSIGGLAVFMLMPLTVHAANNCEMLEVAEPAMIKARAELYMDVLEKNETLQAAKATAMWHREGQKATTLKMAEERLTPTQLNALSSSGCQPWQGASFSLNMDAAITGSVLRIFTESSSKEEAYKKLSRLATVKKLSLIPVDLRSAD